MSPSFNEISLFIDVTRNPLTGKNVSWKVTTKSENFEAENLQKMRKSLVKILLVLI